jgi:hypothetical protein
MDPWSRGEMNDLRRRKECKKKKRQNKWKRTKKVLDHGFTLRLELYVQSPWYTADFHSTEPLPTVEIDFS